MREATANYATPKGRLSEGERRELLRSFDRLVPAIPKRPAAEVDAELAELRRARRAGGSVLPFAGLDKEETQR